MAKYDVARQIYQLEQEIPVLETQLAHALARRNEIENLDTHNVAFRRKLLDKYRAEIRHMTDVIANKKTELWGLQELQYK